MDPTTRTYALPDGWEWPDEAQRRQFDTELQLELAPGHLLFGVPVAAFAAHRMIDDVLFRHSDEPDRFTVIHLTWLGRTERLGYPSVECDGSYSEFLEQYGTGDE